jgi:hypothetical protein
VGVAARQGVHRDRRAREEVGGAASPRAVLPSWHLRGSLKRTRQFKITRSARRTWSKFRLDRTADEVVDALFELPDSKIREAGAGTIERPGWKTAHGRVFGWLVMIGGYKGSDGEWTLVHLLAAVDLNEESKHGFD